MSNRQSTSKLSNFTDLVEIGRGGFGVVYSAKRENGDKVALKKIDRRVAKDRVWNEIRSMRSLKHRNIVEFYEDFVENGDTYVVMELCEHGSLRAYVKQNGPLSEPTAAHVLRQLISAVTFMHRRGILHRDLSAGNVFIKSIRKELLIIKLGDFGLATNLRQGETACTIVGTPGYIAPQVFNQEYDQGADVYSLGGVLYTMLTGRDPPSKGDITLNGVTSNAAHLIERMMHRNVNRRIALTEIALSDFMRDIEDDGLGSREFSTDRRLMSRERARSIEQPSRDQMMSQRRSRERRLNSRSNSQPMIRTTPMTTAERPNADVHNKPPSTSNQQMKRDWPIEMKRCAGQRVKTAGGRYIVESDYRCRFEVTAKGDLIHRVLVVELDGLTNGQKVYVHKLADRRMKAREEMDPLVELTTNPDVFNGLSQLPPDVHKDYHRLVNMVKVTIKSRIAKITYRRPPQFPDAAAQLMENGDVRIKFARSLIVRKIENGDIFNCIDGYMSKRESVNATTLTKVNEVYEYLKRFEKGMEAMGNLECFPIVFSVGAMNGNASPNSLMPTTTTTTATTSTTSRFAFSNISNIPSQMPKSAPFAVGQQGQSSSSAAAKYKFKMDKNNRTIAIHSRDGRLLRQSTRDAQQFIFTDPSIRSDEIRFRKNEKPPERAAELLHYLLPKLSIK